MYATTPVLPGHPEMPEVSFGKPGCNDLPAVVIPGPEGEVISRWKLSDDEMALLVNGGDVYLSIKTFNWGFPPVLIRVATADQIWSEPRNIVIPEQEPRTPTPADSPIRKIKMEPSPDTAIAQVNSQSLAHESVQVGQITPTEITPDFTHPQLGDLYFSRYKEDGRLRLYPNGSYLNDQSAGYSEDPVNIKILVRRPHESFMVILPVRRAFLDNPNAEQVLADRAWNWK